MSTTIAVLKILSVIPTIVVTAYLYAKGRINRHTFGL